MKHCEFISLITTAAAQPLAGRGRRSPIGRDGPIE